MSLKRGDCGAWRQARSSRWPSTVMVHVFQVRELPESKQAIGHMAAFMNARASEG